MILILDFIFIALAAISAAIGLGVSLDDIKSGLEQFRAAFGRAETISIDGRTICMMLIKNPAGANVALRSVCLDSSTSSCALILALNDNIADGRDISWAWDVDFEQWVDRFPAVIVTGTRAEDMALRLKYAGYPLQKGDSPAPTEVSSTSNPKLIIEKKLEVALHLGLEATPKGSTLYILPTYTAMLAIREALARQGYVVHFWEAVS